jgi:hypothetical protein
MNEFGFRIIRALGFGICIITGLSLFHAPHQTIVAAAVAIAFLFVLNILTYWAALASALILITGCLAFATGVTFDSSSFADLKGRAGDIFVSLDTSPQTSASSQAGVGSVAQKLATLKDACDKELMSKEQCEATRTKIVGELTK